MSLLVSSLQYCHGGATQAIEDMICFLHGMRHAADDA